MCQHNFLNCKPPKWFLSSTIALNASCCRPDMHCWLPRSIAPCWHTHLSHHHLSHELTLKYPFKSHTQCGIRKLTAAFPLFQLPEQGGHNPRVRRPIALRSLDKDTLQPRQRAGGPLDHPRPVRRVRCELRLAGSRLQGKFSVWTNRR